MRPRDGVIVSFLTKQYIMRPRDESQSQKFGIGVIGLGGLWSIVIYENRKNSKKDKEND